MARKTAHTSDSRACRAVCAGERTARSRGTHADPTPDAVRGTECVLEDIVIGRCMQRQ
jgi:hypothetical protein